MSRHRRPGIVRGAERVERVRRRRVGDVGDRRAGRRVLDADVAPSAASRQLPPMNSCLGAASSTACSRAALSIVLLICGSPSPLRAGRFAMSTEASTGSTGSEGARDVRLPANRSWSSGATVSLGVPHGMRSTHESNPRNSSPARRVRTTDETNRPPHRAAGAARCRRGAAGAGRLAARRAGAGFGHGIGMSQYGAFGFAERAPTTPRSSATTTRARSWPSSTARAKCGCC